MRRAVAWLAKTQRPDGAWVPLWFGNEHEPGEENPVYGTAAVLKYLCRLPGRDFPELEESRRRAAGYLVSVQQATGGWSGGAGGGPGSIEETGAAVEALVAFVDGTPEGAGAMVDLMGPAMAGAAAFLLAETAEGTTFPPSPIGLYFAKLWYYEKLYPRIAAVSAFRVLGEWFTRRGA